MTDSMFGRVLISSVCGILLCMACLAGTTWAWFTVSVENEGNIIQILDADAALTNSSGDTITSGSTLPAGEHPITVTRNDSGKHPLYLIFRLGETTPGYVTLEAGASVQITLTVAGEGNTTLSWTESWAVPDGLTLLPPEEEETVSPSPSPSADPTTDPSAESTSTPTPTPEPTPTPTPEPAPTPTPEPTPEPTPTPTTTSESDPSPEVSAEGG